MDLNIFNNKGAEALKPLPVSTEALEYTVAKLLINADVCVVEGAYDEIHSQLLKTVEWLANNFVEGLASDSEGLSSKSLLGALSSSDYFKMFYGLSKNDNLLVDRLVGQENGDVYYKLALRLDDDSIITATLIFVSTLSKPKLVKMKVDHHMWLKSDMSRGIPNRFSTTSHNTDELTMGEFLENDAGMNITDDMYPKIESENISPPKMTLTPHVKVGANNTSLMGLHAALSAHLNSLTEQAEEMRKLLEVLGRQL